MNIIIYTNTLGQLVEVYPSPYARLCLGAIKDKETITFESPCCLDALVSAWGSNTFTPIYAETEDEFTNRIKDRTVPKEATDVTIIHTSSIPVDYTFRDAWYISNGAIIINIEKAKEVVKQTLRLNRKLVLQELDIAYIRAVEDKVDTTKITVEKQRLRDITKKVELARSIDELKNITL